MIVKQNKSVVIYTDGACSGNPGIGGWGAVLICGDYEKQISGFEENTTNNRMELTAVISALKALKNVSDVEIFTDSKYVHDGITEWIHNWKRKNWKNVKNVDLWVQLDEFINNADYDIKWNWVKGHNNNKYNEIADKLATGEIKKFKKENPDFKSEKQIKIKEQQELF